MSHVCSHFLSTLIFGFLLTIMQGHRNRKELKELNLPHLNCYVIGLHSKEVFRIVKIFQFHPEQQMLRVAAFKKLCL